MSQKQKMFETMVNHLARQNSRSVDAYNTCMYRGEDGRMCAVGCLISDEAYDPIFETTPANYSRVRKAILASGWEDYDVDTENFLSEMQAIHDRNETWEEMKSVILSLKNVSPFCDLDMPVLETL